jgi:hypothetical protein
MYMRTLFLDLVSAIKKNYMHVKVVLDDALTKYVHQGGSFKSKRPTKHDMYTFLHVIPLHQAARGKSQGGLLRLISYAGDGTGPEKLDAARVTPTLGPKVGDDR